VIKNYNKKEDSEKGQNKNKIFMRRNDTEQYMHKESNILLYASHYKYLRDTTVQIQHNVTVISQATNT
jgi:hypothetical protein